MKSNKFKRLIAMGIASLILLILPIFTDTYYATLYYALIMVLIPIGIFRIVCNEIFEQKFYQRWGKVRKQGFWINLVREGLRSLFVMITIISASQFFVNGRTPLEIVTKPSGSALLWTIFLLSAFSLIIGIVAWHENEKRYTRICYSMKDKKI